MIGFRHAPSGLADRRFRSSLHGVRVSSTPATIRTAARSARRASRSGRRTSRSRSSWRGSSIGAGGGDPDARHGGLGPRPLRPDEPRDRRARRALRLDPQQRAARRSESASQQRHVGAVLSPSVPSSRGGDPGGAPAAHGTAGSGGLAPEPGGAAHERDAERAGRIGIHDDPRTGSGVAYADVSPSHRRGSGGGDRAIPERAGGRAR